MFIVNLFFLNDAVITMQVSSLSEGVVSMLLPQNEGSEAKYAPKKNYFKGERAQILLCEEQHLYVIFYDLFNM